MKIWYGSDLHLEFWLLGMTFEAAVPQWMEYDIFIFAGDTSEWHVGEGMSNLSAELAWKPLWDAGKTVIVIPGNHEYYGGDIDDVDADMEKFFNELPEGYKGIFLQRGSLHTIPGVANLIGGTLWTDVYKGNILAGKFIQSRMNDRANIMRGIRRLSYKDMMFEHGLTLLNIADNLKKCDPALPNIVISHHAPTFKSIHPDFDYNPLTGMDTRQRYMNAGYASNCDSFIMSHKIDYWIHGHIHHVWDYMLGSTRILCNPHGYTAVNFEEVNRLFHQHYIEV